MAIDPTARVLQLLSLLQSHRMWTGEELARELDVTGRTVRRDVDRLRVLGYPVESVPGREGGYRLAAGSHLPPLVLDDDEAVAIAVGLRAAAGAAITGIEETSVRALAKLEQLLPDRLRRRTQAITGNLTNYRWESRDDPAVDVDTLALLAQACRDGEETRFAYVRRDGEPSERLVQPHHVVTVGRRWYLVAWDCRREDWRTFRLDRIGEPTLAGARFDRRPVPGGDPARYVLSSLDATPRSFEALLTLAVTADEARARMPWLGDDVVNVDDAADAGPRSGNTARSRVVLQATDADHLVRAILRMAQHVDLTVDGAPEIREAVRMVGRRLAAV